MSGLRRFGDIRLRLIGVALISALPLVVLGVVRLTTRSLHEHATLHTEARRAAEVSAARIDERLRSADALLLGLSLTVRDTPDHRVATEQTLVHALNQAALPLANLFVLDTSGTLFSTARRFNAGDDTALVVADRGYSDAVRRSRGLVVGELRRSTVLAEHPWVIVLARAITQEDGTFGGVVAMAVRLDSLLSVTRGSSAVGTPVITIYDTSGVVLASSTGIDSLIGQHHFRSGNALDTSGVHTLPGSGVQPQVMGLGRLHTAPWMVHVRISQAALDAQLARNLRDDLVLFLLAVVLAVIAAFLVGKRITKPITQLINAARSFERGETGARASSSGPREIQLLGSAFNQMAETVERRSAALADNERRYRLLFDSNPLPMWAWDAESTHIMAVNDAAIEKYGYDRDHFLLLRLTDLLDPTELPRFSGARLPFSENRQSAGLWLHRTASGRQVAMDVVTTSSRRLGRDSWLSVGIDVTARREAERALASSEEQLRQSQKMEAIGTFASGISHDFNNLLTGMLGYCDLALADLDDDSDLRRDIEEVRALALRGSDLARQILTVSRRQVLQTTTLDPNEVVRGLDRLLRRIVGAHIEFDVRLAEPIGTMRADAGQLEQVLLNLASNARDAMPSGGKLRFMTKVVTPEQAIVHDVPPGQSWILISVSDTGVGMSPEVRDRIFEPFFTTKERGKGTGLGLALAYGMVEQAGGVMRVDTAPGEGTTFSLYFPHTVDATQSAVFEDVSTLDLAGTETILLAEDEESVRTVATLALERQGYRVLAAAEGHSAIAISRAFPGRIHLLLTDVVMPGMNGRQLAQTMRDLRPGIEVIFASGYTDDDALLGDVQKDERAFLQKPFTTLELMRRVRTALDLTVRAG